MQASDNRAIAHSICQSRQALVAHWAPSRLLLLHIALPCRGLKSLHAGPLLVPSFTIYIRDEEQQSVVCMRSVTSGELVAADTFRTAHVVITKLFPYARHCRCAHARAHVVRTLVNFALLCQTDAIVWWIRQRVLCQNTLLFWLVGASCRSGARALCSTP